MITTVDRSQASEDYPLSAVPLNARKPIWSLAPLLMGVCPDFNYFIMIKVLP